MSEIEQALPVIETTDQLKQELRDRDTASQLVREAMVGLSQNPNSMYDLMNRLHNSDTPSDKQLSGLVDGIIGQAKYINGSEVGAVNTPEGLDNWRRALDLAEASFYDRTKIESLMAEIERIEGKASDDPDRELLRQEVLADKKEDLRKVFRASDELRTRMDATRSERLSSAAESNNDDEMTLYTNK